MTGTGTEEVTQTPKTVTEGAVRARHNMFKSSFHLLSDQPLKLRVWGPDLQLQVNKVNTS